MRPPQAPKNSFTRPWESLKASNYCGQWKYSEISLSIKEDSTQANSKHKANHGKSAKTKVESIIPALRHSASLQSACVPVIKLGSLHNSQGQSCICRLFNQWQAKLAICLLLECLFCGHQTHNEWTWTLKPETREKEKGLLRVGSATTSWSPEHTSKAQCTKRPNPPQRKTE